MQYRESSRDVESLILNYYFIRFYPNNVRLTVLPLTVVRVHLDGIEHTTLWSCVSSP